MKEALKIDTKGYLVTATFKPKRSIITVTNVVLTILKEVLKFYKY